MTNIPPDGDLPPIRTTGIGSWPGTDMMDAIKIAFAESLISLTCRSFRRADRTPR